MSNGTEQEARIALLDHYGSLARNWATVLLATAVVFLTVVQVRREIDDWSFLFGLTMTTSGGVYAFLRMVTLGKYCELALDNEVRPLESGTHVTRMLHGMHRNLRNRRYWGSLDKLGDFKGFFYWTLIWVCAWFALASLWTLGYFPVNAWQKWLVDALQYRPGFVPAIPAIAALLILVWIIGFFVIRLKTYESEIETPEG
jgi:hypothetical protein